MEGVVYASLQSSSCIAAYGRFKTKLNIIPELQIFLLSKSQASCKPSTKTCMKMMAKISKVASVTKCDVSL